MGRHAIASTGSDLSEFQVARQVARHCANYTAVLMAIVAKQLVYKNNTLTSASTRVQPRHQVLNMYSTLLILKFSKCIMFKYVYKIINKMYFILYQVLLFYLYQVIIQLLCIKNLILGWN